jgi:DNA repair protein RadC
LKEHKYRSQTSYKTVIWQFRESQEVPEEYKAGGKVTVSSPADVYDNFKFLFENQIRERFVVLWLSSSNRVQGFEVITEGILNASVVHPREVFRGAIVSTSASIILAHNHPSGNAEPSAEDKHITRQMVESGKIVGITVHDHLIFVEGGYVSLAERGLM